MRHTAINLLYSNVHNQVGNLCFDVNSNSVTVDEELVQAKIAELQAAEPMRMLRAERDQLIAITDWRATVDYPGSDQTEWLTYRQALRDLPANSTPSLDDNGQLTGVTWPVKPE